MKKYRAIKRGYDGVVVREVGVIFEFAGKPGSWMVPVEDKEEVKPKEKVREKAGKSPNDKDVI